MIETSIQPYVLEPNQGPAFWTVGVLARLLVTGAISGGSFALVEEWCPPGYATPFHVHRREDETFFVLEGEVTVFCGIFRTAAGPGTCVFGPRNVPHGFRVEGEGPARLLIAASPAGFDAFLRELGEAAVEHSPMPMTPLDLGRLQRVAAQYGIELLGPLPV